MSISYGFAERLAFSHGQTRNAKIETILLAEIPGAVSVEKAELADDRNGTDYWVNRQNGHALSVDAKVRAQDWTLRGADDLALEVWSVVERKKLGWTRDQNKQTDYIIWLWADTGRWCLVPFPMLCSVARRMMPKWCQSYKTAEQWTPDGQYHSMCVFVPRRVVWAEMYRAFGGQPQSEKKKGAS
jgi:hypothetical protein